MNTVDRPLPHNLEAERAVLGAVLLHNDALPVAASVIDGNDFFRDAHRRIFEKMVLLQGRGEEIDLVTLRSELQRAGDLDEVGGPAYLSGLIDGVPRSTNVDHYARLLKEKSARRQIILLCNKASKEAYAEELSAAAVGEQAVAGLFDIAAAQQTQGFVSAADLTQQGMADVERLHGNQGRVTGVATGFAELDELTSGFQPADLVILAARPSMGKTSLAMNIAQHAGRDTTVGVFSVEMSKEQLFLRMLTSEARVDNHRLRGGYLGDRDWERLSHAVGVIHELKIFVDDTPTIGTLEMLAKAKQLQALHGLGMVIVDHAQLIQQKGQFESRRIELQQISRSLKAMAKTLGVPVVLLSQLSRAPEQRGDHRPQLSDLRESGSLEQDADLVVFIYRADQYGDGGEDTGVAELIVAKQRNGPTGVVRLAFVKDYTRFDNLAQGAQ